MSSSIYFSLLIAEGRSEADDFHLGWLLEYEVALTCGSDFPCSFSPDSLRQTRADCGSAVSAGQRDRTLTSELQLEESLISNHQPKTAKMYHGMFLARIYGP